jgi:cbb3-type cytochrome oxidase cytochrome c subunit
MNYGPLIFLAAFFALSGSWFGLVLTPQMQVGQMQPTNTVPSGAAYPVGRPGLAREGLDVYRANGCAWCHSQQVGQTGTQCEVVLSDAGTNQAALISSLLQVRPGLPEAQAKELAVGLPKTVLARVPKPAADDAVKVLDAAGAKASVWIVPTGPDISRGWGKRRTVAEDFLFDSPVMLGSQRIGPDLANVGVRQPDPNWHMRHFYAPRAEVKNSTMPPYRFLFQKRKIRQQASPDALVLPREFAPPEGYEIVPGPEARALVTYMLSLRADAPLFTTPMSVASAVPSNTATNMPSPPDVASTNAAPTNTSAK